ncbi:MAG: EAL domain-containing protein [Phycisphaerales bacterium]|nr:EAL domain-containing protein [Phycisphaerales bacterium]
MITRSSTATDTNTSSVFIGRQPIFDREQNVYAYELLYRSSATRNSFAHTDGDQATNSLIDTSLNVLSLDDLVGKHRAFVNITRKLLLDQTYSVLPKDRVVLELLENIEPDADVIESCQLLKRNGYTLALDDFEFRQDYRPLLDLADIVKIDFLTCPIQQRKAEMMQNYGFGGHRIAGGKIRRPR